MLTIVQKTDAEITKQVVQELRWDCRTETSPITVQVADGIVTLSGQVKYYAIKHVAEEAAHRIAGVAAVKNSLDVKIPVCEFRADSEIAEAVRWTYQWNVLIPHECISVLANNGTVHLYGTVDCISQREEAERAVINLLGVRGIASHLVVKSQPLAVETVCADITTSLKRQAVANGRQVTVDVDKDAVRLSGIVPSWNDRCAVVTAAAFAPGVRQVVDDLKIAVNA